PSELAAGSLTRGAPSARATQPPPPGRRTARPRAGSRPPAGRCAAHEEIRPSVARPDLRLRLPSAAGLLSDNRATGSTHCNYQSQAVIIEGYGLALSQVSAVRVNAPPVPGPPARRSG